MRMVYMDDDDDGRDFAKKAAMFFAKHEEFRTYTGGYLEAGCLFALRFGLDDDCVVVFRLDAYFEPINYQQLVKQYGVENDSNM